MCTVSQRLLVLKPCRKSRLHFTFSLLVGIELLIAYDIYFVCVKFTPAFFFSFRYVHDAMLGHVISYIIWVFRVFHTSYTLVQATRPELIRPWPVPEQQPMDLPSGARAIFTPFQLWVWLSEEMALLSLSSVIPSAVHALQSDGCAKPQHPNSTGQHFCSGNWSSAAHTCPSFAHGPLSSIPSMAR